MISALSIAASFSISSLQACFAELFFSEVTMVAAAASGGGIYFWHAVITGDTAAQLYFHKSDKLTRRQIIALVGINQSHSSLYKTTDIQDFKFQLCSYKTLSTIIFEKLY